MGGGAAAAGAPATGSTPRSAMTAAVPQAENSGGSGLPRADEERAAPGLPAPPPTGLRMLSASCVVARSASPLSSGSNSNSAGRTPRRAGPGGVEADSAVQAGAAEAAAEVAEAAEAVATRAAGGLLEASGGLDSRKQGR